MEVAKLITIFPAELRGAAEGSVLMDVAPGETTHNRMTNGSVSRPVSNSRMTNGTVQKGAGTTLVVRYQDGAQTISVPPNAPVTDVAPDKVTLAAGDTIYAATTEQPNGTLTTNKILLIAGAWRILVLRSTQLKKEPIPAGTPEGQGRRVCSSQAPAGAVQPLAERGNLAAQHLSSSLQRTFPRGIECAAETKESQ